MKLAITSLLVVTVVTVAGAARADTLSEYGAGVALRGQRDLGEVACDMDVKVAAGLATVETRQRFANHGAVAMAAAFETDLPERARVIGAALRDDAGGSDAAAIAVPAGFGTDGSADPDVVGPDPVLIEHVGAVDCGERYRAVLQPIAPGHEELLTTRWTVPVTATAGALRVDLPGRAAAGQLVPCHGTLTATAGPGASIAHLRAGTGDTRAAGTGKLAFVLGDADLALDAELAFARDEPLVWTQRQDLGDGTTAGLVTVIAPPATATSPLARRALFVIDVSRSMDMVGDAAVARVVDAVAAAMPAASQLDAILYDRGATRVIGEWTPADRAMPKIRDALAHHGARNGSDLAGALAVAHGAIADGAREQTTVFVIGDGVLGELTDRALSDALASKPSVVDVHAIVMSPGGARQGVRAPNAPQLERLVDLYGGTYVEVPVGDLDAALAGVDSWVRPSWVDLEVKGVPAGALPSTLRAGTGASATVLVHGALPAITVGAHGDAPFEALARDAGAAPVAALALDDADAADAVAAATAGTGADDDADAHASTARGAQARARLHAKFPAVSPQRSLVVLAMTGRVARDRRSMIAGGGLYTRTAALVDPTWPAADAPAATVSLAAPSAIDKLTLERMFRDALQPAAYACYQRALGRSPKLGGTVAFDLHMSRGEVTSVAVEGLGDHDFDACLVDAAYGLRPPLPDLAVNSDDQTIVHYPLTFDVHAEKPFVVAGDADSSQPIDIDAIRGGVPGSSRTIRVDTRTPLGGLPHD